jgi:hypothetical protein
MSFQDGLKLPASLANERNLLFWADNPPSFSSLHYVQGMTNTTHSSKKFLALGLGVIAAMAFASPAMATDGVDTASDNSDVTAIVKAEIAITATDPAAMTLSHFAQGTSIGHVDVVSTQPAWTISIKDTEAVTPGRLDKTSGLGPDTLVQGFGYAPGLVVAGPVTGSNSTVLVSAANDGIDVGFGQSLAAGEDVLSGNTYATTVQYSVATN